MGAALRMSQRAVPIDQMVAKTVQLNNGQNCSLRGTFVIVAHSFYNRETILSF